MKHYVMFGPPGAGKGTQAALMVKKYNLRHVSTGDLLRNEIKKGTPLGKTAAEIIEKGNLVPDEVVEEMILAELEAHPGVRGFIFDEPWSRPNVWTGCSKSEAKSSPASSQ